MSYILDALNKSEKERTRKKTPGLNTLNDDTSSTGVKASHLLLGFMLLAGINAAVIYYFFAQSMGSETQPGTLAIERVEPASPAPAANIKTENPVMTAEPFAAVAEPEAVPQETATLPTEPPGVVITTHIFASDADLRLVNINGTDRREGATLGPSHRLVAITESGVVLEYRGEPYELNIVEDWQTPEG
jgi:hypothetical protein